MRVRNQVGWYWLALAGNGAGDGNRRHRGRAVARYKSVGCTRRPMLRVIFV